MESSSQRNPAEKQYKVPKGKPDFLTEAEVKKLFSVIENKTHLAIFKLLYLTGMRISEAVNLRWEDINFDEGFIRVRSKADWHTKNYRERFIPIHNKLLPYLKHLKQISKDERVGIKATPHILRHSFATAMASKGVSL